VDAGVRSEVDPGDGLGDHPPGCILHRIEWSTKGQNGTVVLRVGVDIEHLGPAGDADRINGLRAAPFAEVDDALRQHLGPGHIRPGG
jgi:hypothetical protein